MAHPMPAATTSAGSDDVVAEGLDVLEIVGLPVVCIIGIHPHERAHAQALVVSIRLHGDIGVAAARADLSATVDYSRLAGEVTFVLQQGRFLLIESAAVAIARAVLFGQPEVERVDVVVEKPAALRGQGVPRLQISRRRASHLLHPARPRTLLGRLGVLHEAAADDERSLHRVTLPAGTTWPIAKDVVVWSVDDGDAGCVVSPGTELVSGDRPCSFIVAVAKQPALIVATE
jgi:FolB domain-containing protein